MSKALKEDNKLTMRLYTDRLGDYYQFTIEHVPSGWLFQFVEIIITADRGGIEIFEYLRNRDCFSYCPSAGLFLESLWNLANERQISKEGLQEKMNELCEWMSDCERNKPKWM